MNACSSGGGNSPFEDAVDTNNKAYNAVVNIIVRHLEDGYSIKNPNQVSSLLIIYFCLLAG